MTTAAENRIPNFDESDTEVFTQPPTPIMEMPNIIVDEDADDTYRAAIARYDLAMRTDPDKCLGSLQRFISGGSTQEDGALREQWENLTDRHYSIDYYFDGETEKLAADDERIRHARGENAGLIKRSLRLEIYLTRLRELKELGHLALQ